MPESIENKVVLITGASSGIGAATARLLAAHGAKVVLGARRAARLESLVAEIREQGGVAEHATVDVADRDSVAAFIAFAKEKLGRIDVMFNNAGVMPLAPLNALKVDEWNNIIDTNIKGVLHGIAAALPIMEAQRSGHIINTASTAAYSVGPACAVYCGSKFAVRAITEGLRQETDTIRVTLLSPGVTETELGSDITDANSKRFVAELRKAASLKPEAVANAVLYAISQPADVDVSQVVVRPVRTAGHSF